MPESAPEAVRSKLEHHGLGLGTNNKVYWLEDTPSHPRNWSMSRKLYDTATLTSVAREAAADFGMSSVVANLIFAALFFYGQAIGGLILPPYMESFGRKHMHILASAGYCAASAICGVRHPAAVAVGRFVCGLLSAVPTVVGSGSIEDMWAIRPRIWAIDIWIKGSIVGIALGPCFATYVSTSTLEWPWVFFIGAIAMAVISLLFLCTRESRPSVIMQQHITAFQEATHFYDLSTDTPDQVPSIDTFAQTMLVRPIVFFFTEPIVFAVTIMSATVFSSIYLVTEGLIVTYQDFGYTERQASLVFITWIIGLFLTIPLRLGDWQIATRRAQQNRTFMPEDKITGFYVAAPILSVALWWLAWTVPPYARDLSPFVSLASLILVGACLNEFDGILQGYLTDAYTMYAASANAPLAFIRGLMSGSFPLFGTIMFEGLGSNVSCSIMASIATVFCFVVLWFWKYDKRIRLRSPYATKYVEFEST